MARFGETPLLKDLLADQPDAPALSVFGSTHPGVSRGELKVAAQSAAHYLACQGFERGDVIALWLPNTLSWIQLLFASAKLGLLVIPISTRYKAAEVKHLLEVSRARAIVVPRRFLDIAYANIAEQLRTEVPTLKRVLVQDDLTALLPWTDAQSQQCELERTALADQLLSCFSTSGTTGYPKLAAHSHSSIARHAYQVAEALDLHAGDVMLCPLPLFGVFGYMAVMAALAAGASCVLMPVFEANDAARAVEQHRVTHMIGADSMFDPMLNIAGTDFSSWRRAVQADFVGLSLHVTLRGDERGIKFSGTYGSSECYSLMSFQDWTGAAQVRARAGGAPHDPLTLVRIVDPETGLTAKPGEPGEIQIKGPNVLASYLNNPQATAAAITDDGWYRTGDLGYQEEGQAFVYLARMGDSLRLRGYLVNPAEIETCLMQHSSVGGAQVVGVNRSGVGDVAVAYVVRGGIAPEVAEIDEASMEAALIKHCKDRLASYKVPQRVILIEAFPAINGPNGTKIQKRQLREMANAALA